MQQIVEQKLDWQPLWTRQTWHGGPVHFGVEKAIAKDADDTVLGVHYRAWAQVGGPDTTIDERLEDGPYEACDAADLDFTPSDAYRPSVYARDHHIAQAAVARAMMKEHQRSPNDMRELAEALHMKACNRWQEHLKEEQAKRERANTFKEVSDFVDGIKNVLMNGTLEQQSALTTLFSPVISEVRQFNQKVQKKG